MLSGLSFLLASRCSLLWEVKVKKEKKENLENTTELHCFHHPPPPPAELHFQRRE